MVKVAIARFTGAMIAIRYATVALLLAAAGALAPAAFARHGGSDAKRVAGHCTGRSTSFLKVKPDNGRLDTEFEVDQNRNGVRWKVTLRRNGRLATSTRATTQAPSGSFSVERRLGNAAGTDRIAARATSPSGEVCTASLSI
jgi:hypothetical protein